MMSVPLENCMLLSNGKKQKSEDARSGEYGGWGNNSWPHSTHCEKNTGSTQLSIDNDVIESGKDFLKGNMNYSKRPE